MQIVHTIADLREQLRGFQRPAFVPTMGNLHAGHITLVNKAKPLGDFDTWRSALPASDVPTTPKNRNNGTLSC